MKIAICDDNMQFSNYIEEYIDNLPLKEITCEVFLSGDDLVKNIRDNQTWYNIYFMDIEMPGLDGIETANYIRQHDSRALIIFVTEHKEFVYQVFEALPFRFLIKPLSKERLGIVLHEAFEHIQMMQQLFFFKKERENYQIPVEEILYFEGRGRKVLLTANSGRHEFYEKISEIAKKINQNLFMQIHTSYLVNMEYIRSITETELLLAGDIRLPISKKFRKEAKIQHMNYIEWKCGE